MAAPIGAEIHQPGATRWGTGFAQLSCPEGAAFGVADFGLRDGRFGLRPFRARRVSGTHEFPGRGPGLANGLCLRPWNGPAGSGDIEGRISTLPPRLQGSQRNALFSPLLGAEHVANGAELSGMSKTRMRRRQSACRVLLPCAGFPAFPSVVPPSDAGLQKATSRDRAKSPAPLAGRHRCGPASTGSS